MLSGIRQDVTGALRGLLEEPGVRGRGAGHAGARHRRHLGHLQRRQGRAADAAAVRRARPARADLEPVDQLRQDLAVRPGNRRLPHACQQDDDRRGRLVDRPAEPDRRRRAGARRRRLRHRQHVRRAWRAAAARPDVHGRGRSARTARRWRCSAIALWQARYGGDPAIVGRKVLLNDVPVEVVGVMPDGFRLPTDFTEDAAEPTELWRPLQIRRWPNLSAATTATTAPRCWRPGRRRRRPPTSCGRSPRAMTEQGALSRGDAVHAPLPSASTRRFAAASARRCGC